MFLMKSIILFSIIIVAEIVSAKNSANRFRKTSASFNQPYELSVPEDWLKHETVNLLRRYARKNRHQQGTSNAFPRISQARKNFLNQITKYQKSHRFRMPLSLRLWHPSKRLFTLPHSYQPPQNVRRVYTSKKFLKKQYRTPKSKKMYHLFPKHTRSSWNNKNRQKLDSQYIPAKSKKMYYLFPKQARPSWHNKNRQQMGSSQEQKQRREGQRTLRIINKLTTIIKNLRNYMRNRDEERLKLNAINKDSRMICPQQSSQPIYLQLPNLQSLNSLSPYLESLKAGQSSNLPNLKLLAYLQALNSQAPNIQLPNVQSLNSTRQQPSYSQEPNPNQEHSQQLSYQQNSNPNQSKNRQKSRAENDNQQTTENNDSEEFYTEKPFPPTSTVTRKY